MPDIKEWLWQIALQKGVKRIVQLGIAWLMAQNLDKAGVTINPEAATVAIFGGIEIARNWLKMKTGWKFL